MESVPREQLQAVLRRENPWWNDATIPARFRDWRPRPYLAPLETLVRKDAPRRAAVLLGPRRVGKTVLLHHLVHRLIADGVPPGNIAYLSVDLPTYTGLGLAELLDLVRETSPPAEPNHPEYVLFDEVQYLRRWEVHLKTLVDREPSVRFVASGSAAAALKLKSQESGAGRFTDFALPPLTFYEYLLLLDELNLAAAPEGPNEGIGWFRARDVDSLNEQFVRYLNFGGYPEAVLSPQIQQEPGRYIKSDIIDKVLSRDLPSLYGIRDIQELYHLFTVLAYNTGREVSIPRLAEKSTVQGHTLRKYVEYLEAAYLLRVVHRVDRDGKRFKRERGFKVYLTSPSIRAALFSPIKMEDAAIGHVVETAAFAQWFHSDVQLHYASWRGGEVDMVARPTPELAGWATEIKWSDRLARDPRDLQGPVEFCRRTARSRLLVTTRSRRLTGSLHGVELEFVPAAEYCLTVGFNLVGLKTEEFLRRFLSGTLDSPG